MKKLIKHSLSNTFISGGILLTLSNYFVAFLAYVFNFLIAHSMGPAPYGEVTTLNSYLLITAVPVNVVMTVLIQKIGSRESDKEAYAHSVVEWGRALIKRWWFLFVLVFVPIPFMPQITNLSPVVAYVLIPIAVMAFLASFYDAIFQGLKMFVLFSFLITLQAVLKLSGAVTVTAHLGGLMVVMVFLTLGAALKLYLSYILFERKKPKNANLQRIEKRAVHILKDRQLIISTVSILSITLMNNLDIMFVKKYFTSYEAGIYSSWSLLAKVVMYFAAPVLMVSYIFFTSSDQKHNHRKTLVLSLICIVVIGICSFLAYSYLGPQLIAVLFGAKFLSLLPFLPLAGIYGGIYLFAFFLNQYYLSKKKGIVLSLPVFLIIYTILLFVTGNVLVNIMYINIAVTVAISLLFVIGLSFDRD